MSCSPRPQRAALKRVPAGLLPKPLNRFARAGEATAASCALFPKISKEPRGERGPCMRLRKAV